MNRGFKIIIVLFFIIAIAGAVHLAMQKRQKVAEFKSANSIFAPQDTSSITKVIITREPIKEEITRENWELLSDNFWKEILYSKTIGNGVTNDTLLYAIRTKGKKVEFFIDELRDKSLYIYQNSTGKYMMLLNSKEAFEVK